MSETTTTKKKRAAKKAAPKPAGQRGRVSAYAGKKIRLLVRTGEEGFRLRSTGKVRQIWDLIKNDIKVDTVRAKAEELYGAGGFARKCIADFIIAGYIEVYGGGE